MAKGLVTNIAAHQFESRLLLFVGEFLWLAYILSRLENIGLVRLASEPLLAELVGLRDVVTDRDMLRVLLCGALLLRARLLGWVHAFVTFGRSDH